MNVKLTKNIFGNKLAVLICTVLLSSSATANPVVNNISSGNISIQQTNNSTTVNQTSQKGIINWRSFNIGGSEATHFQQPRGGVTLNRIDASQGASQIYGRLTATGQIILVNPSGIYFGPSAYVNVGGLIATTADIRDSDFLSGHYNFSQPSPYSGSIVNEGYIVARDHGLVALVAPGVVNNGRIEANLGKVVLGSGETFTLNFSGDNLVNFSIDTPTSRRGVDKDGNEVRDGVRNTGSLIANGGKVIISAKAASGVLDNVINLRGVTQAKSVGMINGEIILSGGKNGVVRIAGKMDASGRGLAEKGGNIVITGNTIQVESPSVIDVSGDVGGGNINIGGSFQGKGPLPNAVLTRIQPNVKILADAISNGGGGNIIVWGDSAHISGQFSARGGSSSGNGGFVETSGHYLDVNQIQSVDLRSPLGVIGTWLLDPTNIYIATDLAAANGAGMVGADTSADTGSGGDPNTFQATGAVADSFLSIANLEAALGSANVVVTTSNAGGAGAGNITLVNPVTWANTNTLTLIADNNIALNSTITAASGTLALQAGGTISANVANATNAANVNVLTGILDATTSTALGSGAINISSGATLRLSFSGATLGNSATLTLNGNGVGGLGALQATGTNITLTNPIVLGSSTTIGGTGSFTALGSITGGAGSDLTFNFPTAAVGIQLPSITLGTGGDLSVTTNGGAITQGGALIIPGTALFNAGANSITLNNVSNNFTGAVRLLTTGANDASLRNSVATVIGASSIGRSLTINSSGAISQTGAIGYGNTLTLTAVGGITLPSVSGSNVAVSASNSGSGAIALVIFASLVNLSGMSQTADASFSLSNPSGNIFITTPVSVPSLGSGNITFATGGATNSIDIFANITGSATGFVALNSIHRTTQNAGVIVAPGGLRSTGGSGPLGVITLNGNNNVSSFAANTAGGGSISLNNGTNPLTIGTINGLSGLTSNGGNISITSGTLNITQGINSGAGSLTITSSGSITQTSGALLIGGTTNLSVTTAASDILLAGGANNFAGAFTYTGTLSNIRDIGVRNINAAATIPSLVGLTNLRSITLIFNNAAIALPTLTLPSGGNLAITAGGAITQSGVLTVPGTSSFTTGNFGITLNLANQLSGAVSLNNTGANNVSLNNAIALILGASSLGSGTLNITANSGAGSSITQLAPIVQAAGAAGATFTSNSAITLTSANDFTGPVSLNSTGGNIQLTDINDLILGAASAAFNYVINAAGNVTQTGALAVSGASTFTTTGSITLTNVANAFSGLVTLTANGALSDVALTNSIGLTTGKITAGNNVTLTTTAGNIILNGAIDPVNVTINSAGTITQASAGIIIASNLLTTTSVGGTILNGNNQAANIDLTNAGSGNIVFNNQGANLNIQGISNPVGATTVNNNGAIGITGAVGSLGAVIIAATGDLNLAANVSSNASGDAIQLSTGTSFTYTSGSLSTPGGQWLIWSVNPALDTNQSALPFSFIQYNSFFNSTTPSASTARSQSGNGLLYQIGSPIPPVPPGPPVPPSEVAPILQVPITGAPTLASDVIDLEGTIRKLWDEWDNRTVHINPYCSSM